MQWGQRLLRKERATTAWPTFYTLLLGTAPAQSIDQHCHVAIAVLHNHKGHLLCCGGRPWRMLIQCPSHPQVRQELDRRLGLAVRQRHLAKLLRQLELEVPGGATPSAQQLKDALKVARCRYHPDRVHGADLEAKVRAEEISKILNSWELSGGRIGR